MLTHLPPRLVHAGQSLDRALGQRLAAATKPAAPASSGALADLARSRPALVATNALLRQQPLILRRSVKRPRCTTADRSCHVLLASHLRTWRRALLVVQPETVPRWHRQGCRLFWRRNAAAGARRPPLSAATIDLINHMARDNPLWGAERIRGERVNLALPVSKRTVQQCLRDAPRSRPSGPRRATFLRSHAGEIWAGDFPPVTNVLFRPAHAFFLVALASRQVVHVGVTRHPTDAWVAQQLREATPFGLRPRYVIRDNDRKYGLAFARVAAGSQIAVLRAPVRAPRANAACEVFLGSVRRECLDHLLILHAGQLRRALREYCAYFNAARPHQGLGQALPGAPGPTPLTHSAAPIMSIPILGGLHHVYRRAS